MSPQMWTMSNPLQPSCPKASPVAPWLLRRLPLEKQKKQALSIRVTQSRSRSNPGCQFFLLSFKLRKKVLMQQHETHSFLNSSRLTHGTDKTMAGLTRVSLKTQNKCIAIQNYLVFLSPFSQTSYHSVRNCQHTCKNISPLTSMFLHLNFVFIQKISAVWFKN